MSADDLPLTGPPGGSVRYFISVEGLLVADSDDDIPLNGPPGGPVRYIFPGEGQLVADSDDDLQYLLVGNPVALSGISIQERMEDSDELPLSGPPVGAVRYIIPGEGGG